MLFYYHTLQGIATLLFVRFYRLPYRVITCNHFFKMVFRYIITFRVIRYLITFRVFVSAAAAGTLRHIHIETYSYIFKWVQIKPFNDIHIIRD